MPTNEERRQTTEKLSALVEKRLHRSTPYWADEVSTSASMGAWVPRVDYMAFYPNWRTSEDPSPVTTEHGTFEFYEVKSCLADFESGHGLNFEGDKNFLVCTRELAVRLRDETMLPIYAHVLVPDAKWGKLITMFEPQSEYSTRKRCTSELLLCLLMAYKRRVVRDAD